ncbi:MAG TPA: helix-turn-helix domain-containing protein [Candidatus Limnocylindrales bacterium]
MSTRERAADRGARIAHRDLASIGADIRTARISAGLSQRAVGRACRMSHTQVGRIERAVHRSVTVRQLARVGAVVGLDVRVRSYPGPTAVRDAGQVALLTRFRRSLHPTLRLRLEVPIPHDDDQRAWDGVIVGLAGGLSTSMPTEAESRLHDVQGQLRRIQLKARAANEEHVLVVIAATRTNRRAVREAWPLLRDQYPVPARHALAALRAGRHPGGSALVLV